MNMDKPKTRSGKYISKTKLEMFESLSQKNQELEAKYAEMEAKYKDVEEKLKSRSSKSMESHKKNPDSLKIAQKRYYYKKRLEEGKPIRLDESDIANLFS
jgi:predicted nuclease with TOPRIM domain